MEGLTLCRSYLTVTHTRGIMRPSKLVLVRVSSLAPRRLFILGICLLRHCSFDMAARHTTILIQT